jgi:hypothetical protein
MYVIISMVLSVHFNQLMNYSGIWYDRSLTIGCCTFVLLNALQLVIQILCLWELLIHDAEEEQNIQQISQIIFFLFQF